MGDVIKIKVVSDELRGFPNGVGESVLRDDCLFMNDAWTKDYDWMVVYDDFPRGDVGTIVREKELLACPRERTILVTAEPPSIKIYSSPFTRQFGYVLTTHPAWCLPHRGYRLGRGCLRWMAGYDLEESLSMPDYPKDRTISAVCSAKQQKHTQHFRRYTLIKYLQDHLDDMVWYGWGVKNLDHKYDALNRYKYHIAVENYINDYHWSDKISDPFLGLCLPFYAGDPRIGEIFPEDSYIPIPIDDPPEALRIIRAAIANNEYEKRLPAIREARRILVEKYNFWQQVVDLIHDHMASPKAQQDKVKPNFVFKGRHALRWNPLNLCIEGFEIARYKLFALASSKKY